MTVYPKLRDHFLRASISLAGVCCNLMTIFKVNQSYTNPIQVFLSSKLTCKSVDSV